MSLPPHSTPGRSPGRRLKPSHARIVCGVLRPTLGYLGKLRDRMYVIGFVEGDPLMKLVVLAHDALHRLVVELHYLGCENESGP